MKKYIDADGNEYESYEAYSNSPDLDTDVIYNYLAYGKRTPQNEKEERWQREGKKCCQRGSTGIYRLTDYKASLFSTVHGVFAFTC